MTTKKKTTGTTPKTPTKWVRLQRYGSHESVPVIEEEGNEYVVLVSGRRERIIKSRCTIDRKMSASSQESTNASAQLPLNLMVTPSAD